jgi:hypothetical protein
MLINESGGGGGGSSGGRESEKKVSVYEKQLRKPKKSGSKGLRQMS